MAVFMLTPVVMAILVVLAITTSGPPEPSVSTKVPAGYRAVADAYYAYAVPADWKENDAYTDSNGDFFYQGKGGWAAETLLIRKSPPLPGDKPPASFEAFGEIRATSYQQSPASAVKVPGTDAAWEYVITRQNGFRAEAIDAWEKNTRTELWLLVRSTASTSETIFDSLRG
jgi:hypothetical protein